MIAQTTATQITQPEPTEEEIRQRAYQLWLAEGQAPGRDLDYWLAARESLQREAAGKNALAGTESNPLGAKQPDKPVVTRRGSKSAQAVELNTSNRSLATESATSGHSRKVRLQH